MLGMSQKEIEDTIDSACFGHAMVYLNVRDQEALEPQDILRKMVRAVAHAIVANNLRIQEQLGQRGVLV